MMWWTQRKQDALRDDREHQLAILAQVTRALELFTDSQTKQLEESTKGLMAIALANSAQAEAFSTWIKSFQISSPPTSSVVRDEDELADEDARHTNQLDSLPEEFRLALDLQKTFLSDVKGDNRV